MVVDSVCSDMIIKLTENLHHIMNFSHDKKFLFSSSPRSVNAALRNAQSDSEEKFIDLLDIYNQSDLDNGIFNEGMWIEHSASTNFA